MGTGKFREICLGGRFIAYKVYGKGNAYKQHIFVKSRVIISLGNYFPSGANSPVMIWLVP